MIKLASKDCCTGCGACAYACPKQCICMKEDKLGIIYPVIDDTECIDCKCCQSVCPILKPVTYNQPQKAFAAWSSEEEERRTSASGGVAAEVYKEALKQGYYIAGAVSNDDFSVSFELSRDVALIAALKNSKYVFSSAYTLFSELKELLAKNEKVVIIGLPCHIAAIRKLFKDNSNLLLMDVVCHGTTPHSYLAQHIYMLEKESRQKAQCMSFRDPNTNTYTYTFTLYNTKGERFYSQRTKDGDTYQYGYHRMISYRENCYHCAFARKERISDVTLSDYKGIGKLAPCSFNNLKVSSVLVNTEKGKRFIENLIQNGSLIAEERPVMESILGDARLQSPNPKSMLRNIFEKQIVATGGDFESAMVKVMRIGLRNKKLMKIYSLPKRIIKKLFKIISCKEI